ncbi:hypothetical protein C8R43DRAFT_977953 [Mycena crocata]|nr:hypothetical protein C8R43DRAFT_977953 [Mycena crocata]
MSRQTRNAERTKNAEQKRLIALGLVNTTGLPALPTETLCEIVSHLQGVPFPCPNYLDDILPREFLERSQTLLCLSETCRRLREIFLPLAWKHVEVCAHSSITKNHSNPWRDAELSRKMAMELVWHTEIVTVRNPSLAQHVRVVSVVLSVWSHDTVFPEFFHCLAQLPNLETLQVLDAPHRYRYSRGEDRSTATDPIADAISGHTFQGVRTLGLHPHASAILECCPNVEHLTLHGNFRSLIDLEETQRIYLATFAPRLRIFSCNTVRHFDIRKLATALPRGINKIPSLLANNLTPDDLKLLTPMQNLHQIDLIAEGLPVSETVQDLPEYLAELVRTAKTLLHPSRAHGHVTVTFLVV